MNIRPAVATVAIVLASIGNAIASGGVGPTLPGTPYPTRGIENPVSYTFTATTTGDLSAWFMGSTALYEETLGLEIDGVDTGIAGLDNHLTTGNQRLDFGNVVAGQTLVFKINVITTGDTWYTDTLRNVDGASHIWSAAYVGGENAVVPSGTFVAFEDLAAAHSDWNYNDETFVFSNVTPHEFETPNVPHEPLPAVPEPATSVLMLAGAALLSVWARRRTM